MTDGRMREAERQADRWEMDPLDADPECFRCEMKLSNSNVLHIGLLCTHECVQVLRDGEEKSGPCWMGLSRELSSEKRWANCLFNIGPIARYACFKSRQNAVKQAMEKWNYRERS